ncbi:MAG: hypothetical protein KA149_00325 [Chitinophagales bacterium]|nr:hypothetical protein [Chitinophagales bacterium]
MKNKLLLFLLLACKSLWADKTFDSLYTQLTSRADLFVEDTPEASSAMLIYLQQYPDTADIAKWVLKTRKQKQYFKNTGNDKIYAQLALSELGLYDNFSYFLAKPGFDSIIKEAEIFLPMLKRYKLVDVYAEGLTYIGLFYFGLNENKALAYFLLALSQKSTISWVNSYAANNLGIIYRRGGNYEKAIEYMKLSLQFDPTNYEIYSAISFYYSHLHQCDSAGVYLQLAEKNTTSKTIFYTRALAYHFLCVGQYDSALIHINTCVNYWDTAKANSNAYHYLIYFNRDLLRVYKMRNQAQKQQITLNKIRFYTNQTKLDLMGIQAATMGLKVLEDDAKEKGNYKQAYFYKTRLAALNDSAETLGALNVYESIQTKNNYEEKLTSYEHEAEQKEQAAAHKLQRQKNIALMAASILALLLLFSVIQFRNNQKLKEERDRSESLLLNILPAEVAEELKDKGSADAKLFNDVTVLFTDFKSFTTVSEQLSPQQLVDELHACFSAFDRIMAKHQIEKIKTVGDAYLAVSGLPVPTPTHAQDVIKAAVEIREFIKQRRGEKGDLTFDIRIGVHSGSVVAGIVGIKKFAYDIWGDAVNTAARMEQNSEPGRINISESTYALINDEFTCDYRGEIAAKNKGKLKMYFVA